MAKTILLPVRIPTGRGVVPSECAANAATLPSISGHIILIVKYST